MKTTLLIFTLNEIDGMKAIMPRIRKEWCDQILIVDGKSQDGTVEYARSLGYEVVIQNKKGIRHAFNEAFPYVKGDVVITFSPDGNSIPELIPNLIGKMKEGYDMVIVSRYLGDAKSEDDTLLTTIGNWIFTQLINWLHGGKYTDAMVIFRAYRTELFCELGLDREEAYKMERLFKTVISIEPLLSVRAAKQKLKIAEIPGDEPKRLGGVKKVLPFRWGGSYLLQVLRETYYWRRPLKLHEKGPTHP